MPSEIRTRPSHKASIKQVRPHHRPRHRIPTAHRNRRLEIQPKLAIRLQILRIANQPKARHPRIQHIPNLLPVPHLRKRPLHRLRTGEPALRAIRVWIPGAHEAREVGFVGFCEGAEAWEQHGQEQPEGVVFEIRVPEGREQVGCVPAGEGRVLHVVGLAGEGGGEPAGVAGHGAVADEVTEAVALGCVFALAVADGGVHCFNGGEEVVGLGVLGLN
jgi:hypothetical protein